MQIRITVLVIDNIIHGECVNVAAEFFVILADPFQNAFDLTIILSEKGRDPAGLAEIHGL